MKLISKTVVSETPSFDEIKKWYFENLHPDNNQYDDPEVFENVYHKGNWAGIFQCTSQGTQQFFKKSKPNSIVDLAVLTSIWRPGPLQAGVDKLWLKAISGEPYDWGHPIFEKVLGETNNLLIFQESMMKLLEVVGNFPPDQVDNARRAILKRDASKAAEKEKEADAMEDQFVEGAIKNGVPKSVAHQAYKTILYFSGYAFNRSHAIAYGIDSYLCAWLLTHYPNEWLASYLESMCNSPEGRFKAFAEVRSMGYKIVTIDMKFATKTWTILPGKKLMPSLLTCKGLGDAAADELISMRPLENFEQILWDDEGNWKPSKLNKRALEALIKAEAFQELDCVGEGKLFKTYRQMHEIVIENMSEIKKSTKKEPHKGRKRFFELLTETENLPEWTRQEKINNAIELFGSIDTNSLVPEAVMKIIQNKKIISIDETDKTDICWFIVMKSEPKKTKNGKNYLMITALGSSGKSIRIFMWSWDGFFKIEPYSVCVSEIGRSGFGASTTQKKIRILNV